MKTSTPRKRQRQPSSVRHTRAIQRDRTHRLPSAPPADQVVARLQDLVQPATFAQLAAFQAAGLRQRVLTLPVMVAFVLSLIWRQLGSVREAVRCLNQEGLLWTSPTPVSAQAAEARLRTLPPPLFKGVIDLGFWNYAHFDELATAEIGFLSRVKQKCVYRTVRVLRRTATVRESLIYLGPDPRPTDTRMRLVAILVGARGVRDVTNVLEPTALPAAYLPLLYAERWRIEDAFNLVKRLLGRAYFWSGAGNAIQTQVWASWPLYGVLLDLTDEVAARSRRPVGAVSVEMVFRALYHYTQAVQKQPGLDLISYLVGKAAELDVFKARWHPPPPLPAESDAGSMLRC